jgi:hypothetical protein
VPNQEKGKEIYLKFRKEQDKRISLAIEKIREKFGVEPFGRGLGGPNIIYKNHPATIQLTDRVEGWAVSFFFGGNEMWWGNFKDPVEGFERGVGAMKTFLQELLDSANSWFKDPPDPFC